MQKVFFLHPRKGVLFLFLRSSISGPGRIRVVGIVLPGAAEVLAGDGLWRKFRDRARVS